MGCIGAMAGGVIGASGGAGAIGGGSAGIVRIGGTASRPGSLASAGAIAVSTVARTLSPHEEAKRPLRIEEFPALPVPSTDSERYF